MESFKIAHLNLPGPQGPVNVIIVFVNAAFAQRSVQQKNQFIAALEQCAGQENLAGNVVPVWEDSSGRLQSFPPPNQRPFFASASYPDLARQINHTLSCG